MPAPSTLPASAASGAANSAAVKVATFQAVRMVTSWLHEDGQTTHGPWAMFQDQRPFGRCLVSAHKNQHCLRVTTRQRSPATCVRFATPGQMAGGAPVAHSRRTKWKLHPVKPQITGYSR